MARQALRHGNTVRRLGQIDQRSIDIEKQGPTFWLGGDMAENGLARWAGM